MSDDSLMDCSFFNDRGNLIITESTNLAEFLKEWASHWSVAKQDCITLTQAVEKFYRDQCDSIKAIMNKVSTIQEALSSATVESFYNIMVNEVKNSQKKEMDELKTKLAKVEKEKRDYAENTSKVIEKLTLLSVQKDDQLQNMTSDMSMLNQSFSVMSEDLLDESSKKKKQKESKKEVKLKKQVEEMEAKIISLQKQVRDTNSEINYYKRKEAKWSESEQDFIKRIYILEEFMIRSYSVIQRRAAKHMKTLKKAMSLDLKIFDTLMQKQEWSLRLDENKKQLTNSIKELEEFSKSLGGLNNMELEQLRSKINEDTETQKEDKDQDDDEDLYESHRSMSVHSPDPLQRLTASSSDMLNNTLDLGDDYTMRNFRKKKHNGSPTPSENPEFEDYLKRLA